jgi:hypothetical protein
MIRAGWGWAEVDLEGRWWATCQREGARRRCGPFATAAEALERARTCSGDPCPPMRRMTDVLEEADRNHRMAP